MLDDNKIESAIAELESHIEDDDISLYQEKIVSCFEGTECSDEYVTKLLSLMERYEDAYWGAPGEFVHYLESLPSEVYESKLIESVLSHPTNHTLWMLNRVINGKKSESEIKKYCDIFEDVLKCQNISETVRKSTERYLAYQKKRIYNINNGTFGKDDVDYSSNNPTTNLLNLLSSLHIIPKDKQ